MEQSKIDRINELARLAKQRELTEAEAKERQTLRQEYLAEWRKGAEATLNQVVIVEPDGTKRPLKRK